MRTPAGGFVRLGRRDLDGSPSKALGVGVEGDACATRHPAGEAIQGFAPVSEPQMIRDRREGTRPASGNNKMGEFLGAYADGAEICMGWTDSLEGNVRRALRKGGKDGMRRSSVGGFTLIELLVVIAIIAILAAILFPVFAKAREKARQASCTSNLKELGLAMMMYIEDYDERLPGPWRNVLGAGQNNPPSYTWRGAVLPYIKNTQVYFCPSHTPGSRWPLGPNSDWGNASYAYNAIHWAGGVPHPPSNRALASMQYPAETVILMDHGGRWAVGIQRNTHDYTRINIGSANRHNDGAVYAYMDGHVKWMKAARAACLSGATGGADNCMWSIQ